MVTIVVVFVFLLLLLFLCCRVAVVGYTSIHSPFLHYITASSLDFHSLSTVSH